MIILKNKTFTRAEKEAIKELLLKTRGLRKLPSNTNLKCGHSQRLGNAAADLRDWADTGKRPDTENIKELLSQWNLPKGSAAIDKVIDKYSNKRAIARLERMQKNKKGDYYLTNPNSSYNKSKPDKYIEDFGSGDDKLDPKRITWSKGLKRLIKRKKDTDKFFLEYRKKPEVPLSREEKRLNKKLDNLLKEHGVSHIKVRGKNGADSFSIRAQEDSSLNPKMYKEKCKKELLKNFKKLDKKAKEGIDKIGNKGVIVTGYNTNPATGFHEFGHLKFNKTSAGERVKDLRKRPKEKLSYHPIAKNINTKVSRLSSTLGTLAKENGASEQAIQDMIRSGASKKELRKAKDLMRDAGETYLTGRGPIKLIYN